MLTVKLDLVRLVTVLGLKVAETDYTAVSTNMDYNKEFHVSSYLT